MLQALSGIESLTCLDGAPVCLVSAVLLLLTLRNLHRPLYRLDGWYLALHHSWGTDDPLNLLDLWGSARSSALLNHKHLRVS